MWLFTKYGFTSIVRSGFFGENKRAYMVRTRSRLQLEQILDHYTDSTPEIVVYEYRDYRYRAYVTHDAMVNMVTRAAEDIDYTNFKGECSRHHDLVYTRTLHRVWDEHYKMQETYLNDTMSSKKGYIVEDSDMTGGVDADGNHVIVPKTPQGKAPKRLAPTDESEATDDA